MICNALPRAVLFPVSRPSRFNLLALAVALLAMSLQPVSASPHTWSGAGGDRLFSNPANWASGGAPVAGEIATLIFPTNGTAEAIVNVTNLTVFHLEIQQDLTLRGTNNIDLTLYTGGDVLITAPNSVTLDQNLGLSVCGANFTNVHGAAVVHLMGPIHGCGFLYLAGPGSYRFEGPAANTFTGPIYVLAADLQLAKSAGVTAIPTNLLAFSGSVSWFANEQVANTNALLTLVSSALNLNGFTETVEAVKVDSSALHLSSGVLSVADLEFSDDYLYHGPWTVTGTGSLSLRGDMTAREADVTVFAPVQLTSVPRGNTIKADGSGSQFIFRGPITGAANASVRFQGGLGAFAGDIQLWGTNTFSGVAYIDAVNVWVIGGIPFGASSAGTVLTPGAQVRITDTLTIAEPLTIIGGEAPDDLSLATQTLLALTGFYNASDHVRKSVTFTGSITVSNRAVVSVGYFKNNAPDPEAPEELTFSGPITGSGGIHKLGPGKLLLTGTATNSFAGGFYQREGLSELRRSANAVALPGPIFIGDGTTDYSPTNGAVIVPEGIRSFANHQIGDSATVFLRDQSWLDLQTNSEALASLDFTGGSVSDLGGRLDLSSNIFSHASTYSASVSGYLVLGAGDHLFQVETGSYHPELALFATISGGLLGSLTKTGPGELMIWANNSTFTGPTAVHGGKLSIQSPGALGPSAGVLVNTNATLEIAAPMNLLGKPLALQGGTLRFPQSSTNTWGGPVTLVGENYFDISPAAARLLLTNVLSGTGGFVKQGTGKLELSGTSPNTFVGDAYVSGGGLVLNKVVGPAASGASLAIGFVPRTIGSVAGTVESLGAGQVGDLTAVSTSTFGVWNLNGFNDTIGSLAGYGSVALGLGTLTHGGLNANTIYTGQISGTASTSLVKQGQGTFTMTGNNSYTGRTTLSGGKLIVNGTNASSLTTLAVGTTLGASGQVSNITASAGTISPGSSPGQFKTGNLVFSSALTYRCELNGTNAGVNQDQLLVTGTVNLGNSTLHPVMGYAGAVGNKYTLIVNDSTEAVSGTFIDLPEGAIFYASGAQFSITYVGGTGNDVVLTQLLPMEPPQLSSIAKLGDGTMHLTGLGRPGQLHELYATTNLAPANWVSVDLVYSDFTTGVLDFTDPFATNYSRRFYRIMLP